MIFRRRKSRGVSEEVHQKGNELVLEVLAACCEAFVNIYAVCKYMEREGFDFVTLPEGRGHEHKALLKSISDAYTATHRDTLAGQRVRDFLDENPKLKYLDEKYMNAMEMATDIKAFCGELVAAKRGKEFMAQEDDE